MNTLQAIFDFDTRGLLYINRDLANPFFDMLMPLLREKYFWIWLYVLLIFLAVKNDRRWLMFILLGLATFALCDFTSASLIKPFVQRVRPCNDVRIGQLVRQVVSCGSGYSFVSSHAANHFGLAMVFGNYLKRFYPKPFIMPLFLVWAGSIAFAQVYVGVHYPLDVVCGALLGIVIGIWINRLFNILNPAQTIVS